MKFIEVLKHNFVLVPVVASVIFGTFTGIKYVVDVSNTIHTSEVEVQALLKELKETQAKYDDKIDNLKMTINQNNNQTNINIADVKAQVAKLEASMRMGEDLYRVLADQVREHSYDIKDLNR
jgi:D-ribose pyranose/furanose isomerase RbsD